MNKTKELAKDPVSGLAADPVMVQVIQVPFDFNTRINQVALFFSAVVKVVFCHTPAPRAARLNPIDAVRHE